ncbi:MAG: caspase family protein [Rubrivivax sp.]|nr:caspase family protein [Rubrivivax sp.]
MSVIYRSPGSGSDESLPGTHVLVIGIGDYPHLSGGSAEHTTALGGLGQLETSTRAARAVADWFKGDGQTPGFNDPEAPLATVELLVSRTVDSTSPGSDEGPIDLPTSERIMGAFQDWLQRLQVHERNVGVFYFCGHGVHLDDDVLLASDFGRNKALPWADAFNISETITAMRRAVAGPLYFFLDTCRETFRLTKTASARPLVQLQPPKGTSEAHMLVLQGANPGASSFAQVGQLPFFTGALLQALSGAAYVGREGSAPRVVTSSSLVDTVAVLVKQAVGEPQQTPHGVMYGQDRHFHVERLAQQGDQPPRIQDTSQEMGEPPRHADSRRRSYRIGATHDFTRTANDEEACLHVNDYADVVADLFSQTRDELCFAIFGAWGRGKTFLAERIGKALIKRVPKCQTVRFSAWQFPTTPEVWVHLYETFADVAFKGSFPRRIPNIVRTGIAKNGYLGLLLSYAAVAIGAVPIFPLLQGASVVLFQAYLVLGVYGMIFLWTLFSGIRKTKSRLAQEYLTPNRHTEKLGLQATIGKDLRHLLDGWMPVNGFPWLFHLGYWAATACLAGAAILRLGGDATWTDWVRENLGLVIHPGGGPVATGVAVAMIIVSAALALAWLRFGGDQPSRVLLIVDDLDRCHPDHLISVVESIKLLVEDPVISSRVQVLMLVEEEVLRHAILEKYGRLVGDRKEGLVGSYDAPRLVRETCEKLFTAQLRLPQLSTQEVRDLVETFSGFRKAIASELKEIQQRSKELRSTTNLPISDKTVIKPGKPGRRLPMSAQKRVLGDYNEWIEEPEPAVVRDATQPEVESRRKEAEERSAHSKAALEQIEGRAQELQTYLPPVALPTAAAPTSVKGRTLTEDEIKAILEALFDEGIKLRDHLGPRTVRAFLFRYQLARLILIKLQLPWDPSDLARGLATEFMVATETKKPLPPSGLSPDVVNLARVIDQVS